MLAAQTDAKKYLNSKSFNTSEQATHAVMRLSSLPADECAKAVDGLDDATFAKLLDLVPEDQREHFELLVEASQNPERKLAMWSEMHKARAKIDLQRYEGDFGDDDARSDTQQAAYAKYQRREKGVESDAAEVDDEVARLRAKEKNGSLTVADVDAMRERKDLELSVEMKHNVNLTADKGTHLDGSRVEWEPDEIRHFDHAVDQLPDEQVHGPESVERFHRRANQIMVSQSGQYEGDHIDIYDNAATQKFRDRPSRASSTRSFTRSATTSRMITRRHSRNSRLPQVGSRSTKRR